MILFSCTKNDEPLTICFTGDLLLDRGVREQIEHKGVDALFESVAPLFRQSDAVVVNLECPVTERIAPVNKRFIFRAEPQGLPALKKAGITHAALANNHTNDQGRDGLKDTYNHLKNNDLIPVGAGKNAEEAAKPVIIEKGRMKVAIFNSVLVPLENWMTLSDYFSINQQSAGELCENIRNFKQKNKTCYAVAVLHWGVEYQPQPTADQRFQAHQLIDAGADAIIGHHPHVLQSVEYYRDKPIFYSLGNFIFDSSRPVANEGLIAELIFSKNNIAVKTHSYKIIKCKAVLN
ncbi:MAG: CapA family protein [Dysgonamonadaceae bacterium]|jgi:poly-gamma-glutamate synthesis protein (capsule biosynthesis protein)|nr:CapA family protein [Dysgonamonadaceae bacterium]